MSRLICGFIVLLGIAFAAPTVAQQKPDFTGTWVIVSPAESAGSEQEVRQTATTISTGHASEGGDGHHASYKLDGTESRNELTSHGEQIVTTSKAVWEGAKLVITASTKYPGGQESSSKSVWSLDAEGRLVIEHTRTQSGQPPLTITIVHTKKTK